MVYFLAAFLLTPWMWVSVLEVCDLIRCQSGRGDYLSPPFFFFLSCSKCWHSCWLHKSISRMFWMPGISWPFILTLRHRAGYCVVERRSACSGFAGRAAFSRGCSRPVRACLHTFFFPLHWLPAQMGWYAGNLMTSLNCEKITNGTLLSESEQVLSEGHIVYWTAETTCFRQPVLLNVTLWEESISPVTLLS